MFGACSTIRFLNRDQVVVSVGETQILLKRFKDGSQCKAIIVDDHQPVIKYSKTPETVIVQFSLNYGCWNAFGIAQHVL